MRLLFKKGEQRKFIEYVLLEIGSPSLRELINRGINVSYSSLKNYYSGRRLLPEHLFDLLRQISGLKKVPFSFELVSENWGKVKGGKVSKRS